MSDEVREIAARVMSKIGADKDEIVDLYSGIQPVWLSNKEFINFASHMMREGMIRAADMCASLPVADRLRAEADKLEGKP